MPDCADHRAAKPRFQFSILSMLLAVTVVCLAIVLVQTSSRLASIQRELATFRPLPLEEVARQFEERTSLAPLTVEVRDVRYSSEQDSYKVEFSWTNAETGKTWFTDVFLQSDGFGSYFGRIRNGPFIEPLGHKDGFVVSVEAPSALAD